MNGLIIPMLVEAYAAGDIRPSQFDVPVLSPNYKTALANSVLGSQNTPGTFEKGKPLEAGIHLHFILPDAFTQATDDNQYPAVPNRFAVTRIWKESNSDKLKAKCFIVESDYISLNSAYKNSITIPCFGDADDRKKWRYLGRSYEAGKKPAATNTDQYLDKLTAVGAGDALFAAYYPSCRSVFGFYDDLADLPKETSLNLSYFVTGWFANQEDDPFSKVKTEEDLKKTLDSLAFSVDTTGKICNYALFYGAIETIEWKGFSYNYSNIPKGKVKVVFANNSVEALSKTVTDSLDTDSGVNERMLTALQYELYDHFDHPDGNFLIDDTIHYNDYARQESNDEQVHISVDQQEPLKGQMGLGGEISDLKAAGNTLGKQRRELSCKRKTLFTLWEQYILLYENDEVQKDGYPSKQEIITEIERVLQNINELTADVDLKEKNYNTAYAKLSDKLPKTTTLERNGSESFFAARNPVLLLSGDGIHRTFAFGEDGRFTGNGTLACQSSAVSANLSGGELLKQCFEQLPLQEGLPDDYQALLIQTCLICEPLLNFVRSRFKDLKIEGSISSEIELNKTPLDYATLFMIWGAAYYPTHTNQECDNTLDDWKLEYGDTNLVYKGGLMPQQLTQYNLSGQIVLTPHAVKNLSDAIKRYAEISGEEEKLDKIAERVKGLSIISQNLSGFTDFFSGLRQTLQFPIMGIGGDVELVERVGQQIGMERESILPHSDLLPLRGGYVKITDLSLVSSFGLTQPIVEKSYYNDCEVDFAETVACGIKDYGMLAPVFSDAVRLRTEFVSAGDSSVLASTAPETSPVRGIVVPELLNHRALIFTADGTYVGMVKTVYRNGKPSARWLSAPTMDSDFEKIEFKNEDLKEFVKTLITKENAFYEWNELLNVFLDSKQYSGELLWGRPLVLARIRVNFEFSGSPQFRKKYEDFKKYNSCGVEKVRFQLGFGDIERIMDGVCGCFKGQDFSNLYAPFGASNPCGSENYVRYSGDLSISNEDGDRYFTMLFEPDSIINIQSGVLPVKTLQLEAVHTEVAKRLPLSAEISPILSPQSEIEMPQFAQDKKDPYKWYYYSNDSCVEKAIIPPVVAFAENVLMDGFIMKEGNEET